MNLQNWVNQARAHWKEFQPTRFAELTKVGALEPALQDAAQRTATDEQALIEAGHDPQAAWEAVRERYLFPPEEESSADPNG